MLRLLIMRLSLGDRKSTRLNSSHLVISYAVFCLKKKSNEISSSIVRWTGTRRVEEFVKRLYRVAKEEDPDALVTYVNYPSTEYLHLPFSDFLCFNLYLESEQAFENYIARLHSLSQDRPV